MVTFTIRTVFTVLLLFRGSMRLWKYRETELYFCRCRSARILANVRFGWMKLEGSSECGGTGTVFYEG
jgi:hypothetical protein